MYTNKIPKKIYLCYKHKNIPDYIIPNWEKLNPDYKVMLYDNTDCRSFLEKEYDEEYVKVFDYIKDGPIKADFWRLCILYKYGGVYCDVDIEPLVPFSDYMEDDIDFLTCISMTKNEFNPHIIMSTPNNIILKKNIDIYLSKYRNNIKYEYWEYSIIHTMTKVLYDMYNKYININGIYVIDGIKCQFVKEIDGRSNPNDWNSIYTVYKDKKILNNRYKTYNAVEHTF
jgi:hypothetical protein